MINYKDFLVEKDFPSLNDYHKILFTIVDSDRCQFITSEVFSMNESLSSSIQDAISFNLSRINRNISEVFFDLNLINNLYSTNPIHFEKEYEIELKGSTISFNTTNSDIIEYLDDSCIVNFKHVFFNLKFEKDVNIFNNEMETKLNQLKEYCIKNKICLNDIKQVTEGSFY